MAEAESTNTMFQASFVKNGDGDYALKTTAGTGGGGQVQSIIPTAARASSLTAEGKVAAPGVTTQIAMTTPLAVGTWDIDIWCFISGTTAALDIDNMQIKQDVNLLGIILTPINGTTGAAGMGRFKQRIQVATAAGVKVQSIAAATAGSTYFASISATRVL